MMSCRCYSDWICCSVRNIYESAALSIAGDTKEFDAFLAILEELLTNTNSGVKELAAVGVIED